MIVDRSTTAMVVDSTADLPDNLVNDPNLTLVPLTVFFGEEAYLDWVELRPEQFYEKLVASAELPHTSQPAPGLWSELYGRLREQYQQVYSVHLSAEFSGTCETARAAAAEIGGVTVVDSRLATGGIALLVDRMMERIDRGTAKEEFDAYIEYFHANKTFLFLPTTLDYLYKGEDRTGLPPGGDPAEHQTRTGDKRWSRRRLQEGAGHRFGTGDHAGLPPRADWSGDGCVCQSLSRSEPTSYGQVADSHRGCRRPSRTPAAAQHSGFRDRHVHRSRGGGSHVHTRIGSLTL